MFAALAILSGELVGLTVAMLGIWFAITYGRRLVGLGIALVAASWTVVCLLVVIPAFNDDRSSRYYAFFEDVGGSPWGLLRTLFTDPGAIIEAVATGADARYVILLLLPTAFLAVGQPLLLAAAVPQLGVNLVADFWTTTQPMFPVRIPPYSQAPAFIAATNHGNRSTA